MEQAKMRAFICLIGLVFCSFLLSGQEKEVKINLAQCIDLAIENSLQAFRAENDYQSGHWDFLNYKASRLPSLSLRLTPIQYNSQFTKRYDYIENIDIYRQQQLINSSAGISLSQNVGLTGGTFTLESELNYMKNYGDNPYTQYSSIPVRFGYSQSLFGFNRLKWVKKTEPLKYEKAKKQFLYSREATAATAIQQFFNLASAQAGYTMALENVASADTLFIIGKEKNNQGHLTQADLLTLELDLINATNALENSITQLERASYAFLSFLNLDINSEVDLEVPDAMPDVVIPIEEALFQMKQNNPDILSYRLQEIETNQALEQMQKTGDVDAHFSASVGFNQAGQRLSDSYNHPLRQDMVNVSVTIPIVDWGTRKRRISAAKNNRDITMRSIELNEQDMEQEIRTTISEFNRQKKIAGKSLEALTMSIKTYNINKQRYITGTTDMNTLTLSLNRKENALRNYLSALSHYWSLYYTIRKLTLFDFEKQEMLSIENNFNR